jgi:hypothetical protein
LYLKRPNCSAQSLRSIVTHEACLHLGESEIPELYAHLAKTTNPFINPC